MKPADETHEGNTDRVSMHEEACVMYRNYWADALVR